MIGDFSARANASTRPPAGRPGLMEVTAESLDALCHRIAPELLLRTDRGAHPLRVPFNSLDDFHPDRLWARLDLQSAVPPVARPSDGDETGPRAMERVPASASTEGGAEVLQRLLGERPLEVERRRGTEGGDSARRPAIEALVRRLAGQAGNDDRHPSPPETIEDPAEAASRLRSILHAAEFQALEALWRSLDWLLRSVETDPGTVFHILDIRPDTLLEELNEGPGTGPRPLHDLLQRHRADRSLRDGNLLLIWDLSFGDSAEDIRRLEALGSWLDGFGGTLIGGIDVGIAGHLKDATVTTAWQALRRSGAARRIHLALPRVLLRLPYGNTTDPVDAFDFEEMESPGKGPFLWGNPAFACAILMLQNDGSERPEPVSGIADMPAYSYTAQGESRLLPATEVLFDEGQIDGLLGLGLIPVLGSPRDNMIRIPWLQSLSGSA